MCSQVDGLRSGLLLADFIGMLLCQQSRGFPSGPQTWHPRLRAAIACAAKSARPARVLARFDEGWRGELADKLRSDGITDRKPALARALADATVTRAPKRPEYPAVSVDAVPREAVRRQLAKRPSPRLHKVTVSTASHIENLSIDAVD
jgi:hypothetical protein